MRSFVVASLTLALGGCSHLIQFTNATPDPAADAAFVQALDGVEPLIRACYAKVNAMPEVPIELAVDESGAPLAAKVDGPLFGSTLGGCLETVAFRTNLGPANQRRLARAVIRLRREPADVVVPAPNTPPPSPVSPVK